MFNLWIFFFRNSFRGETEAKQPIRMAFINYCDHVRNLVVLHWKKKPENTNTPNCYIWCSSSGKENSEHDLHVVGISHMTWGSSGKSLTATGSGCYQHLGVFKYLFIEETNEQLYKPRTFFSYCFCVFSISFLFASFFPKKELWQLLYLHIL